MGTLLTVLGNVISLVSFWIGFRTRWQSQLDRFRDLKSELLVKITETRQQINYIRERVAGFQTEMYDQLQHLAPELANNPKVQLWKDLKDTEAVMSQCMSTLDELKDVVSRLPYSPKAESFLREKKQQVQEADAWVKGKGQNCYSRRRRNFWKG
jgi:chromosome segregation ATPase